MKIGILTQPLKNNYGGILQAYALQTVLSRLGHEVILINRTYAFPSLKIKCRRILSVLKAVYKIYLRKDRGYKIMNPFAYEFSNRTIIMEHSFVKKHIKLSKPLRSSRELKEYIKGVKLDCYIVGSDQVWRKPYSPQLTNFFLDFIVDEKDVKRIAYAASFGTDSWECDNELTNKVALLAKKFDAISVREKSGIKLCNDYLRVEAKYVLDPTLLLTKDDYTILYRDVVEDFSYKNKIMCYVLDENKELSLIAKHVSELKKSEPLYVELYGCSAENSFQLTIEQWLKCIAESEYVITDSFHACVFAIIFRKPFLVVGNISRGITRILSLLEDYDLGNRLVYSYKDFVRKKEELLGQDWVCENIENIINDKRRESYEFLTNAIDGNP